jgi:hypothetical protein
VQTPVAGDVSIACEKTVCGHPPVADVVMPLTDGFGIFLIVFLVSYFIKTAKSQ